jgi:L-ascorbate metabolism protein UlaG (beta-lactamase superfamily)
MKITKFGHACLEIEENGQLLILDPGMYTQPLEGRRGVQAIVITHIHDDHCFEEQLDRIIDLNPGITIYGTDEVCKRLAASRPTFKLNPVHHGDFYEVGGFTLEFFGDIHAEIHRSIPLVQNCGVMVNGKLYYPGDSFTQPDREVAILACPASAPWLKISEVMDFISAVKPKRCFPTHNIHLSEFGNQLNNGRIQSVTEQNGGQYEWLQIGESTEV